jgi:hypothetical protein
MSNLPQAVTVAAGGRFRESRFIDQSRCLLQPSDGLPKRMIVIPRPAKERLSRVNWGRRLQLRTGQLLVSRGRSSIMRGTVTMG